MKMACARCVEDLGLLNLLVRLLDATQQCLSTAKGAAMPKYVHFPLYLITFGQTPPPISKLVTE